MYNILLALDNSEHSKKALELGIDVAKNIGAKLNLLFVVENKVLYHPFVPMVFNPVMDGFDLGEAYSEVYEKARQNIKEYGKKTLTEAKEVCRKNKIDFVCFIREGILSEEISDLAQENDLIIMGKYGLSAQHSGSLLGSAVEEVARITNKPLLIASDHCKEIKNVAIAFDNSEFANKTLRLAFWMKNIWKEKLQFQVFSVVSSNKEMKEMQEIIDGLISEHEEFSSKVLLSDEKGSMIINHIEENDLDLLMMGAYGHSIIRELIIGSTTSEVIRKSKIAVLLNR